MRSASSGKSSVPISGSAIAFDATYSLGRNLSGVGVYSREILFGLARAHPDHRFRFYYRSHRILRSLRDSLPGNASRRLLRGTPECYLFHALNQRVDPPARAGRPPRFTIATFHDLFVMTGEYSTPEFRARFTEQARQAAERSDAIIAVSEFTAQQVASLLNVERSRIFVVPHGVRSHPRDPKATLPTKRNIVLFVGAIQKRKNIARLVQAFEALPADWRLVLAGSNEGYAASDAHAAIEASPRRASIDVLGYVSETQLEDLYQQARIFAFPSLDEGFGIPVLEAMARGVPVITSNTSAMPEVAGDAALLVDPFELDQIAAALRQLAADQDLAQSLITRGTQRVAQFSWDRAVKQTWDVYRAVTGEAS